MAKRICFIGDSHVGALRLGLNESGDASLKDMMDIFGSRGPLARHAKVTDQKLVPTDPEAQRYFEMTGGAKSIDLNEYEHICVVGCGVNLKRIKKVCSHYSTFNLHLDDRQLVSAAMLDAIMTRELKNTIAYQLVEMISSAIGKPVYFVACPLFSETVVTHWQGRFLNEIISAGVAGDLLAWYDRMVQQVFGKFAHVIGQPDDTRTGVLFTKDIYSKGSKHLADAVGERPEEDFAHMNALYGREVLDHVLATLP